MPPRRQAAPKSESKTGLVIALVFFILTTIILGVVAYMGYDGQTKMEKDVQTAKDDAKKANDAGAEARARLLANQIMMGTAQAPRADELGNLNGNAAFAGEVKQILATFGSVGVSWDNKTDTPPESVLVMMKKLQAAKETAENNSKTALADLEKARKDFTDGLATAAAAQKQAETKQKEFSDKAAEAQKLEQDAKNFAITQINTLKTAVKEGATKAANREADLLTEGKKKDEEIAGIKQTEEKLKAEQNAVRQKILLTDKVHGHVTKVDNVSNFAFIDLGSADFIRPTMSFSILMPFDLSRFGPEDTLPKKATVQVVEVLGSHQSRASIRYEDSVDSIRNPVAIGDKLYKPGWKPGNPVHWALAGHFDLNGLGRDETRQLVRMLAKQGIVVDAYLDLNTLKVVGELNYGIDYLIVGNRPTGETGRVVGEERKKAVEEAINSMVDQAQKMGITVMQHRVFLPIAGIDLPRQSVFPNFGGNSAGASEPMTPAAPKDEAKPKANAKPKAPPKEDEDK